MRTTLIDTLRLVALASVLCVGVSYALAWTGPTAAPPSGDTPAPVNVSATVQVKSGSLGVADFVANSVTVGGTPNASAVTSPEFCIGTSCITAWPTTITAQTLMNQLSASGPKVYVRYVGSYNGSPSYYGTDCTSISSTAATGLPSCGELSLTSSCVAITKSFSFPNYIPNYYSCPELALGELVGGGNIPPAQGATCTWNAGYGQYPTCTPLISNISNLSSIDYRCTTVRSCSNGNTASMQFDSYYDNTTQTWGSTCSQSNYQQSGC